MQSALTPGVKENIIAGTIEHVLRIAEAQDVALLSIVNLTPCNCVCSGELDAVYPDGVRILEVESRRVGVLWVDPSLAIV